MPGIWDKLLCVAYHNSHYLKFYQLIIFLLIFIIVNYVQNKKSNQWVTKHTFFRKERKQNYQVVWQLTEQINSINTLQNKLRRYNETVYNWQIEEREMKTETFCDRRKKKSHAKWYWLTRRDNGIETSFFLKKKSIFLMEERGKLTLKSETRQNK